MTIGEFVEKYCWDKGASILCQSSLPVVASRHTRKLSGVSRNNRFPHIPRPRFPVWVPPFVFQTKCHRMCPSRASAAHALSGVEKYSFPFTSRIELTIRLDRELGPLSFSSPVPSPPIMVGVTAPPNPPLPPPPALFKPAVIREVHTNPRFLMFD